MNWFRRAGLIVAGLLVGVPFGVAANVGLKWRNLPPVPDPFGFAGHFAGVAGEALLVAGGSNFSGPKNWAQGGQKVWHDRIFMLNEPNGHWREAGRLPRAMGYGVSLTLPEGLLCIGGADAHEHVASVFLIRRQGDAVAFENYPALPMPLAYACGAVLGRTVYVAGGRETPAGPIRPLFLALELDQPVEHRAWRQLEPWPGRARILACAGVQDGAFFVFGGSDLVAKADGKFDWQFLREAWSFRPGRGWKRIADMPFACIAAPSPLPVLDVSHLALLGGEDDLLVSQIDELKERHPGFSSVVYAYDTTNDCWQQAGRMPYAPGEDPVAQPNAGTWPPIDTPAVAWRGGWVLANGEVRPGTRTPRVLFGEPASITN